MLNLLNAIYKHCLQRNAEYSLHKSFLVLRGQFYCRHVASFAAVAR